MSGDGKGAEAKERRPHGIDPQFVAWLLVVIGLTGGSALWRDTTT